MENKYLGILLGLHCGDSLGATLEFGEANVTPSHTEIIGGGPFNWKAGDATDDTDLMMVVLRSVVSGKFDEKTCIDGFIQWYNTNPKDIGSSTRWGIEQLIQGRRPVAKENAQGNGSIMRVAPLALISNINQKEIEAQCSLTHPHPNCILSDFIFINILQMALNNSSKQEIFNQALVLSKQNPRLHQKIQNIPSTKWDQLSTSGFVFDTLCCAIWALYHGSSFEESIVLVVNRGDDSDSNGAVAGALCGAFYGANEIPSRWITKLQYKNEISVLIKSTLGFP